MADQWEVEFRVPATFDGVGTIWLKGYTDVTPENDGPGITDEIREACLADAKAHFPPEGGKYRDLSRSDWDSLETDKVRPIWDDAEATE